MKRRKANSTVNKIENRFAKTSCFLQDTVFILLYSLLSILHPASAATAQDNIKNYTSCEGLEGIGAPCTKGVGACEAEGTLFCFDGNLVCHATPKEKTEERCDEIDNDCDGENNEGFIIGVPCDSDDLDLCANGVKICSEDGLSTLCKETIRDIIEICDYKDNNCNGFTDEGFNLGIKCDSDDTDLCANGVYVCSEAGFSTICKESVTNIEERCDDIDNDCDGENNEGFNLGIECDSDDSDLCAKGTSICSKDGTHTICKESKANISEVCDGEDNNCDGLIDNNPIDINKPCSAGLGACRNIGNTICEHGIVKCNAYPFISSRPEIPGNDIDENCDGIVEQIPPCKDSDGDSVCDANDICPGENDKIDRDQDGVPDCENPFAGSDDEVLTDLWGGRKENRQNQQQNTESTQTSDDKLNFVPELVK